MKKLMVTALVCLGLLCFGSAALAEGFTVGADYSSWDNMGTAASVQGEWNTGPFFLGGSYGMVLDCDEVPWYAEPETYSYSMYSIYGGYYLLDAEPFRLGAVVYYQYFHESYYDWDYAEDGDVEIYHAGVGLKASLQLDAFEASLMYVFGLTSDMAYYRDGSLRTEEEDFDTSYLEVKCAYQFSETFGAYAIYRGYDQYDDFSGFGVGLQITL